MVVGARRVDRLEALAETIAAGDGSVRIRALDVVSRQDTQAFIDYAREPFGRVDVMVNNAGVMSPSPLAYAIEQPNDVDVSELVVRPTS